jgi:hypothetical protein
LELLPVAGIGIEIEVEAVADEVEAKGEVAVLP